ncbi:carboxymuconolactone decarboxylase family protein [Bosea caraganae]|uniref:carboxymuconolactone decarboxylase family protein n=1 Tax=Bosea caraganae TaxID=2763117 RepID=UPI0011C06E11|nr:carboxymuconolactone decarboxylase family protein [Bosea caraganae]
MPDDASAPIATPSDLTDIYRLLLGHVPEHIERRWATEARLGRENTGKAIELLRRQCIAENPLGLKVQQIVQFGQLLALLREPEATRHAIAALRAGASFSDLAGAAESGLIVAGMQAYSLGLRIIDKLAAEADAASEAGRPAA